MKSAVGRAAVLALSMGILPACTRVEDRLPDRITFTEHVAPIIFEKCAPCHRPGESAPFDLLTYADVERRAQQIAQVTRDRFMPPWLPEPGERPFVGDRRLSDREIDLIRRWVKRGALEGDPQELPALPRWSEGWLSGEPDLVVEMPETYVLPAEGFDVFRNFVIPIPVDGTRWVGEIELRPGNKRIVHHAIMRIDRTASSRRLDARDAEPGFGGMDMGDAMEPDGHFLGWTPGKVPAPSQEGTAWRLDRGTDLVLQLHMLPTGKPERIRPVIGFHFVDEPKGLRPFILSLDNSNIDIPAGERDYVIRDEITLPVPVAVTSLYPHAHYLGKVLEGIATLPDGRRVSLIRIPDWDFNWQDEYRYVEPLPLPAGTTIAMRYRYDNSSRNPRNPSIPPVRVVAGNRSLDEMGTLTIQVLIHSERDRTLLQEAQSRLTLSKTPGSFVGHNNLGTSLLAQDRMEEALLHLRRAAELRPGADEVQYNLGIALAAIGETDEAIARYREALRLNPWLAPAENNLGNALLAKGKIDEAISRYRQATKLQPDFDEAHYNLGNALLTLGRFGEAAAHYEAALRVNPGYAMTHNNLAVALQSEGKDDEALDQFRRALEIDPELVEAHTNLAIALSERDRLDEAAAHLREALRLRPDDPLLRQRLRAVLDKQSKTR